MGLPTVNCSVRSVDKQLYVLAEYTQAKYYKPAVAMAGNHSLPPPLGSLTPHTGNQCVVVQYFVTVA